MSLESLQQLFTALNTKAQEAYVEAINKANQNIKKELENIQNTALKQYVYHQMITPNYGKIDNNNLGDYLFDFQYGDPMPGWSILQHKIMFKDVIITEINNTITNNQYIVDVCVYFRSCYNNGGGVSQNAIIYIVVITNLSNIYTFSLIKKNVSDSLSPQKIGLAEKIENNIAMTDRDIDVIKSYPIKQINSRYDYRPHTGGTCDCTRYTFETRPYQGNIISHDEFGSSPKSMYDKLIKFYMFHINNRNKPEVKVEDVKECCVCFETISKKITLIPCGHTQTCHSCAKDVNQCPLCKTKYKGILEIYL